MKTLKIIFESIFLIVFVFCLACSVALFVAVEDNTHKALYAITAAVLSAVIYAWTVDLIETIKEK